MPAPSMLRLASSLLAVLLAALIAAPAGSAPPAPDRPAHVPALQVVPERVYEMGAKRIALVHGRVRFRGRVRQYVPGQVMAVQVTLGKRRLATVQRTVTPRGTGGEFSVELKAHRRGRLRAAASGAGLSARSRPVDVVRRAAFQGQRGLHVQFLQHRLRDLRYLVKLSGRMDGS